MKTNQTIYHVNYLVTITRGSQTLLNDMFHSDSGILILRINSADVTAGIVNSNATRDPILHAWTTNTNNIVYINASMLNGKESVYHIRTQILSMDQNYLFFPNKNYWPTFDFFTRLQDNDNQQTHIPLWFKKVSMWFSTGQISGKDFTGSIEYLIEQGALQIPQTQSNSTVVNATVCHTAECYLSERQSGNDRTNTLPSWIKENTGKWAVGGIQDEDFAKVVQYLINNGFIITGYHEVPMSPTSLS